MLGRRDDDVVTAIFDDKFKLQIDMTGRHHEPRRLCANAAVVLYRPWIDVVQAGVGALANEVVSRSR